MQFAKTDRPLPKKFFLCVKNILNHVSWIIIKVGLDWKIHWIQFPRCCQSHSLPSTLNSAKRNKSEKTACKPYSSSGWTAEFEKSDKIRSFSDVDNKLLSNIDQDSTFAKYNDYGVFYKLEQNVSSIPEITQYIKVDSNLRVQ